MADMIEPKDVAVKDQKGNERSYVLSKFPAMDGIEIVSKLPLSTLKMVENYASYEAVVYKVLSFVAVRKEDATIRLTTRALIDNHIPDWETILSLLREMAEYNMSFFLREKISTFFADIMKTIPQKLIEISTDSLAQSLKPEKQPFTN